VVFDKTGGVSGHALGGVRLKKSEKAGNTAFQPNDYEAVGKPEALTKNGRRESAERPQPRSG
jgi:hypothetical protein